jgi:2-dehydropantoate 2-reductase
MRVAVVGAGAVGGVVAWHLARAGLDPVLVGRPETMALIERDGLTVERDGATETVRPRATAEPGALGAQDVVLVGFKAQDWAAGLPLVLPLLGPRTSLVPMLNGVPWWFFQGSSGPHAGRGVASVDPDGALLAAIPSARVLGCVVYVGAERVAANHIRWNGRRRLVLGAALPGGPDPEPVAAMLRAAGITAEAVSDIRAALWGKLLGNVTFNPISALTGAVMGRLVDEPALARVVRAVMAEAAAVGGALGVAGEIDLDARMNIAPEMRGSKTSMLQDMEAGRPLELGAIVHAVAELGALAGVATPTIEMIGALAEERARNRARP